MSNRDDLAALLMRENVTYRQHTAEKIADVILAAGWTPPSECAEMTGLLRRVHAAAEPRNLLAWEARHGLTIASVCRYITAALAPGHPALPPAALTSPDPTNGEGP